MTERLYFPRIPERRGRTGPGGRTHLSPTEDGKTLCLVENNGTSLEDARPREFGSMKIVPQPLSISRMEDLSLSKPLCGNCLRRAGRV